MIVRVLLQVLVQLVDVSGQQSDLDFGRASVLLGQSDFGHNFLLVHSTIPLYKILCANGTAAGNGIPKKRAYSQPRTTVTDTVYQNPVQNARIFFASCLYFFTYWCQYSCTSGSFFLRSRTAVGIRYSSTESSMDAS